MTGRMWCYELDGRPGDHNPNGKRADPLIGFKPIAPLADHVTCKFRPDDLQFLKDMLVLASAHATTPDRARVKVAISQINARMKEAIGIVIL